MLQGKPVVRLWNLNGVGLIIAHPTGVLYSNQVGGFACDHPVIEGAFIVLTDWAIDQQGRLEHFFTGPKWKGHCYGGIDEETADFVDGVLAASDSTDRLLVDRKRLAESAEAWIHVVIAPPTEREDSRLFDRFPSGSGVFTWANSD